MTSKSQKKSRPPRRKEFSLLAWGDVVIVLLLLSAGICIWPFIHTSGEPLVVVFYNDRPAGRYPLSIEDTISIRGARGMMTIAIVNHTARVLSSSCHKKICVHSAPISLPREQIICAPNHILITIHVPRSENTIDAISR